MFAPSGPVAMGPSWEKLRCELEASGAGCGTSAATRVAQTIRITRVLILRKSDAITISLTASGLGALFQSVFRSCDNASRVTMRASLLLILICLPLFSESPSEALKRRREEYPDLTRIVDLAQGTAGEFAAQALLRVAGSPGLRDKIWKAELLEQAFQNASAARNPIKKHIMGGLAPTGSRAAMASQAAALGLDRLTLQTEVVKAMLTVNPKRARELFLTIQQPVPARLHCEDALLDDPSSYFSTASSVADSALFLNERIQNISSAVEVAPVARMLAGVIGARKATQAQLKLMISSFAAALQRIDGDDRSFSSSLPAIAQDVPALAEFGILAEAYRQFLVKNLTGSRCSESVSENWQKESAAAAVSLFNTKMSAGGSSNLAAIQMEELKPAKVEGKAIFDSPFAASEMTKMRDGLMSLLFGKGQVTLTEQEKNTNEWREQFAGQLKEIEGIKLASGESEAAFFFRKGSALHAVLVAAPPGAQRDQVLAQYIAFLRTSNFQQESLTEWFSQVESLVNLSRAMNESEHKKLLDALENSGHAVLALYAVEEKLLPAAPSWVPKNGASPN